MRVSYVFYSFAHTHTSFLSVRTHTHQLTTLRFYTSAGVVELGLDDQHKEWIAEASRVFVRANIRSEIVWLALEALEIREDSPVAAHTRNVQHDATAFADGCFL